MVLATRLQFEKGNNMKVRGQSRTRGCAHR
jgi:hypothetical protein